MTDLVVTAANVIPSSGATRSDGVLDTGVTVTAGQAVYRDATTQKLKLTVCTSAAGADLLGIAEVGGSPGQRITVIVRDESFAPGATVAPGIVYYLSETPGGICPVADIGSTDYTTVVMVGVSTSKVILRPIVSGAALT